MVMAVLQESGLAHARLELEITESHLLERNAVTLAALHELRASGVRIAIDDFGVGYSSLGYLPSFPFDKLKIDRTFVSGAGRQRDCRAIVRAITGLCSNLVMTCAAEGVETEEQLATVTFENCTEAQGYLFSPALAASCIPAFLKKMHVRDEKSTVARRIPPMSEFAFRGIVESANDIVIVTTADSEPPGPVIIYVNPAFTRLTGYSAEEVIGLSPRLLQGPGTDRGTLNEIRAGLQAGRMVHEKVLNFAKSGAPYWLDLRISPLRDDAGCITHYVAIERDVTMEKRRLDELEFMADRDTLTGIPNRRALLRMTEAEIAAARACDADKRVVAGPCMAFIDVDHFKQVNDTFGHAAGDAVLFGLADRLAENVRRADTLGRIGGEEFAVCMPGVTLNEATMLAERLRRAVAEAPVELPSGRIAVTVSIGVAAFDQDDTLARLMGRADAALYAAKSGGRDRVTAMTHTAEPRDRSLLAFQ
jgi:diguanylate cyclase (GGDEF)-like protein/PAS domain S-box-containing protein